METQAYLPKVMQLISVRDSNSVLAALSPQPFFHAPLPPHPLPGKAQSGTGKGGGSGAFSLIHTGTWHLRGSPGNPYLQELPAEPLLSSPIHLLHGLIHRPFPFWSPSLMTKYVVEGEARRGWTGEGNKVGQRKSRATQGPSSISLAKAAHYTAG